MSPAELAESERKTQVRTARMERIQRWLMLAGGGAMCLFLGARDFMSANAGAALQRVPCSSLESGQTPDSTWLELEGRVLESAAVSTDENDGQHLYVPLVSPGWSKQQPLAAILRFQGDVPRTLDAASFRGAVSSEDLPGMVRVEYEAAGLDARDALVLKVGEVPAEKRTRGQLLAAAGLLALLIGAFLTRRDWD